MVLGVVAQMAPLAPSAKVAPGAVLRLVIEVRDGQHDLGQAPRLIFRSARHAEIVPGFCIVDLTSHQHIGAFVASGAARNELAVRRIAFLALVPSLLPHPGADTISFQILYGMWDRNSLAGAGVARIVDTVWRDMPALKAGEQSHSETAQEKAIRETFDDRRLWQKLAEAHMRSLVGDYGGAIPAIGDLFDMIGQTGEKLAPAIEAWKTLARTIAAALNLSSSYDATANAPGNADNGTALDDQVFFSGQGDQSGTGNYMYDPKTGNIIIPGDDGESSVSIPSRPPPITPPSDDDNGGGGGGGGGGEDKAILRRLESLQNSLATEAEWLTDYYEEGQKTLDDALAARLISEEEFRAERERLEADHLDRMRELDRAAMQEKLAGWSGALGDLASLMTSGNKKMFAIGKAAAVAQAIVDGWSAATSAWDKGMKVGGPPVAAAFTAMSLARTGAMIASLKSTSFNGGGSGGTSGGSSSAPAAAPQAPMEVRLSGDGSSIGWGDMGTLLTKLNEEAGDRGYRILVAT